MQITKISPAKMLSAAAACVALAFVLNQVAVYRMPMGGSVTPASMLFIVLAGYWLGPVYGILSGVALGLLDTATGAFIVHPVQYLLDYILGFGMLGIAGFFRTWKFGLQIGYIAGVLGRFAMVFLSGAIFFGAYAPEGQHVLAYSFLYNITYIGPEAAASLIIISLPAMKHAIDVVTKTIVPPAVYAKMIGHGSFSDRARLVTGGVIGALGGMAFVLSSHISRVENLVIAHFGGGVPLFPPCDINSERILVPLFGDPLRIERVYRTIGRNAEHLFALNTVGVLFVTLGAVLLFSVLLTKKKDS